MESVEIMKGVEHIGEYAFSYCISLTSIKYGGTVEDFGHLQCWRAFFGVATGVVECTDGDVALS